MEQIKHSLHACLWRQPRRVVRQCIASVAQFALGLVAQIRAVRVLPTASQVSVPIRINPYGWRGAL